MMLNFTLHFSASLRFSTQSIEYMHWMVCSVSFPISLHPSYLDKERTTDKPVHLLDVHAKLHQAI